MLNCKASQTDGCTGNNCDSSASWVYNPLLNTALRGIANMVGKTVSVILRDGHDIEGKLMEASEQTLVLTVGKINAVVILANVIMILEGGLNIETEDMGVA